MDEQQINETLQKGIRAARRGRAAPARRFLTKVIQTNPGNEEAWLWLSRVVDSPLQRAECLQRVVQINPDNRWAAEQLAELQAATAAPIPTKAPTQPPAAEPAPTASGSKYQRLQPKRSEIELEALKCPQCGGGVDIQGGVEVKTLVCSYCGSVLDLTSEQATIIGQIDRRTTKPLQPIELGMEGRFDGEVHQVIGWIRYEGWDDEDRWRWEEWLLVSSSGRYLWLSYDREEGFTLHQKIKPVAPFHPQEASSIKVPGGIAYVTERAPAKVIALNGELTWQCNVGEQLAYFDAKRGSTPYSVEYTKSEIEIFEGQPLSDAEVWTAFGREDLAKKAKEIGEWNTACKVIALFCVILALFSCSAAMLAGCMGRELAQEQLQMVQGEGNVQAIGPIELTQPGKVHRIQLQAGGLPVGTWAIVDVSARDTAGNTYYLFSGEFWDEEGYDSDGYWHENDLSENYLFKLENPGEYYLDLSMEEATVSSLPVMVTLEQGIWVSRYFVIFLVICVVLAFVFYSLSQKRLIGRSLITSK